ncbi:MULTISPECIES: hypothetical protein [unclassified Chryseobacterium]|uniref:hypothetical protein n=1 Tax=unclassified Chryseobacterium TaxID=2593645 RepID=UPI00100BA8F2|nr:MULTISPECIES: hypothetical protein [unclassified Chryseobacterium]RXM51385.1 hypothetical protein BOQ64_15145 [Chryseobacterium sp. CH25]RXM64996.1 hypothetical protein BOQ60_12530 [Chryseobacterium sp. CH1]
MKTKLITFLSLSMLLASCAQDETRDEVMPTAKQVTVNENNTSRISFTKIELIKESGPFHPEALNTEESLKLEHNGSVYRLIMQWDNNLVLYRERQGHKTVLWHSNTHRTDVVSPRLVAQTDGNLVIYSSNSIPANSIPIWSADTTVNYHVNSPHIKMQLCSRTGTFIPSGYRIKVILGGNNEERKEIIVEDFY